MHLFLDTNVYLGFYKLSGDDLEELRKLVVTVRSERTTLYVSEHQRDEFRRNRGTAIAESLKLVEEARLPTAFPRLFQNFEGYPDLRRSTEEFDRLRRRLVDDVRVAAHDRRLHADLVIDDLFEIARMMPVDDALLEAARRRRDLGNPPGKQNSIGDAINWESLLGAVPERENLLLVTGDRDYVSKLDPAMLDEYLKDEWSARKAADVSLYPNLTALFRDHYPDIRLAAELEKEVAIAALIASTNFRDTHLAIARLGAYPDLTDDQVLALAAAAGSNTQIKRIIGDPDVHEFFTALAEQHAGLEIAELRALLGPDSAEEVAQA